MENSVTPMQVEEKVSPLRRAVPGLGYAVSLALSDVVEENHEQGYSYVAVISGVGLFEKGKPW
jgi:hypothetical protein